MRSRARERAGAPGRRGRMKQTAYRNAGACLLLLAAVPGSAQKSGGILQIQHFDSPASMSILEESTRASEEPMMAVFNNIVLYKQDETQNRMDLIVPDLATGWSWGEDGKDLTFPLHKGVKWHDGKPFTAADVKCTWDRLRGADADKFRLNPRKAWYRNVEEITTNGDQEVTFHLKRPQPYLIALLASGLSPVNPCHVTPAQMRQHPIGTGPFKFVEFKPNERIKVVKNPEYWKPGRPYLDGIETTIIPNTGTRHLAFTAGKFDMLWMAMPLLKEVQSQAPQGLCDVVMDNNSRDLLINRAASPFDKPELRRAMALSLDHQAFIDIMAEGE